MRLTALPAPALIGIAINFANQICPSNQYVFFRLLNWRMRGQIPSREA
jgi:hypothetical protein